MKRTHIIQDVATLLYFREVSPGDHQPTATEQEADFYSKEDANAIVAKFYAGKTGPDGFLCGIREGSASAYMRWLGRRGGKVMTDAKRKANRRRPRRKRGMTYNKRTQPQT